jgi:histidine triad (HIT) family protein
MNNCIFCKIIAGQIPAVTVHEDDTAIVFIDINQSAKGHLLFVPRTHTADWHTLDHAIGAHLVKLAAELAPAVLSALGCDGYNLTLNNGKAAGQEVMHVHLHLIPRWRNDRSYRQPHMASAEERQQTANLIKNAMPEG